MTITITATNRADLLAQVADLTGSASNTGTGGGTTTTPPPSTTPPDTNTYPFTNVTPDATKQKVFEVGTGRNTLALQIATSAADKPNRFAVKVNGKIIANPILATLPGGMIAAQTFIFHGNWGALDANTKVEIVGVPPEGISQIWVDFITYDVTPLVLNNAISANSRGTGPDINVPVPVYNSGPATSLAFTLPVTVTAPPPSGSSGGTSTGGTPTLINGKDLAATVAAAASGSTLTLPAQTIVGTAVNTQPLTIAGAGIGQTIIDATGIRISQDKAVFLVGAPNSVFKNMTVKKAWIATALGQNGAGFRNSDGPSVPGFSLNSVEIANCQNGILTQSDSTGTFDLVNCNIHDNGETTKPGNTHNLYMQGTPQSVLKLTGCTVKNSQDGHEVKSRCGTTIGRNNKITSGGNGRCYSIDNGGILDVDGDVLTLSADPASNNVFVAFSTENKLNASLGQRVKLTNTVFNDPSGRGGYIASFDPAATLDVTGSTYTGAKPPILQGWASVTGAITKAT